MTDEQNDDVCDEARDICRLCAHSEVCWDTCRAYEERYETVAEAKGYDTEGGAE